MDWRSGCASAAFIIVAQAAQAQSVSYDQALQAARVEQPVVQAREAELAARQETAAAADQLPDPTLSAGIVNLPVTGPNAFDPTGTMMTMLQVGVRQDFPNLAKRRARASLAGSDIDLAEAQIGVAGRNVELAAGRAWISLVYAQRRLALAEEAQTDLRKLVPVARSAVAAGSARPAESLEIRRALLDIDDVRTRIEADREAAKARLARYVRVEDPAAEGNIPSAYADANELRATLERNPQIVVAGAVVSRAEAATRLAQADKRPDFGVSVSYGVRDRQYGDLLSVMGSVTLPLWAGQRQDPRIRAAEAQATAARAEREDALREVLAQFEADLAAWRSSARQWQRAREELLPLARNRADLETASFAAGRAELIDVIAAKTALALLELEVLEREEATVEAATKLRLTYREQVQ
jgi:outer membrane protein, heavy metal efflux system